MQPRVSEDVASADESGVSGTPTFFINGRRHYGAYDIATLTDAVQRRTGTRAPVGRRLTVRANRWSPHSNDRLDRRAEARCVDEELLRQRGDHARELLVLLAAASPRAGRTRRCSPVAVRRSSVA